MFNRTRDARDRVAPADEATTQPGDAADTADADQTTPEDHDDATEAPVPEEHAYSTLEQLLDRLETVSTLDEAPQPASLDRLAGEASTHAEMLHSTLDAQKQAQRMLALATKLRGEASAQAERILQEAQATASRVQEEATREVERARQETASWTATRRREVETTVAELLRTAQADADRIRADAERTAMARADESARQYAARMMAAADRDADATRVEALDALDRARAILDSLQSHTGQFSDAIASFLIATQRHDSDLRALAEETGTARAEEPVEEPNGQEALEDPTEPAEEPDEHPDGAEPAEPTESESEPGPTDEPDAGRPLGSLFRTPLPESES